MPQQCREARPGQLPSAECLALRVSSERVEAGQGEQSGAQLGSLDPWTSRRLPNAEGTLRSCPQSLDRTPLTSAPEEAAWRGRADAASLMAQGLGLPAQRNSQLRTAGSSLSLSPPSYPSQLFPDPCSGTPGLCCTSEAGRKDRS